ncbi:hypothetical protein CC86DRAFT_418189 [Ophiobolus disseminans]|uniref:Uncharacterized protein n=1 Tax=Ophiobolus disseminans TaxID=1469910 RepID=A0A6A6ZYD6_9PLEO|nr:hypothetical protein CC86DRAFT_418189 [Ophiobolus disseminans]
MDRLFARHILPVLLDAPWPQMKKLEIRGVGDTHTQITQNHPPTREELEDVEYIYVKSYSMGGADMGEEHLYNARAATIPSVADMENSLGELIPQATILVEEEADQNFEAFIEVDYGVMNDSDQRKN